MWLDRTINYKPIFCLAASLLLLALGGCKVTAPGSLPAPARTPEAFGASADSASVADLPWREFFADRNLVSLIDTALRNNPDLRIALQRVEAARADVLVSRGALLPTVSLVAAAGVDKYGDYTMNGVGNFDTNRSQHVEGDRRIPNPTPDYLLGLRSSWEIDLWGKLRNRKKAAYARFLASEKGRQLAVTSLVAGVAGLYYELLALDGELDIVRKNIGLQEKALETIQAQKQGGRATQLAVQQFQAQLLHTRSLEADLRQSVLRAENRLNGLLGRYPQPISRGEPILEQPLPERVYAGLPAGMLRRRPDVQGAELQLAASRADVDAARAAFLPSLTLTPYAGFNAFRPSLLFNPGSVAYGALAGLAAPLLNRRGVRGEYNRAAAGNLEAFHAYQRAVLTAYEEVVTNLNGLDNLRQAYALREESTAVLLDAVSTANDLYVTGYASYLEVITAQRNVLEAELELTETRKSQFLVLIDLYRSLGGGWK
jgi:NodT family efflux transporter outer membrane factor (OMF) lipoprotein